MVVGLLTIELFLAESNSLKEKRRIVKSLLDRLSSRFNVSCAEVSERDTWQRASLAVVHVNTSQAFADRTLSHAASLVEQSGMAELLDTHITYL